MTNTKTELDLAHELIEHGVPVFLAESNRLRPKPEFYFPQGWQTLEADTKLIKTYKPNQGDALCAVTGVSFDVIDVDVKNFPTGTMAVEMLQEHNAWPPIYGEVSTPSGGSHYYVRRTAFRKFIPWPGVDYQAGDNEGRGRGFVFLPGTERKWKYPKGCYKWVHTINWEGLFNDPKTDEYMRFGGMLWNAYQEHGPKESVESSVYDGEVSMTQLMDLLDYFFATCRKLSKLKEGQERNTALSKVAYLAGRLITGSQMDEKVARESLISAGIQTGLSPAEVEYTVVKGIDKGKTVPLDFFKEKRK